jgi:drug/metabolite transporter (DMT)-like permease
MNNALLIALLGGIGGMLGWGSADFFAKKTIDRIGPMRSLVWAHIFGTVILSAAYLLQRLSGHGGGAFPSTWSAWGGVAFFGVLQMIVYWLVYQGFEKGQVSVLNPVFASYSGLVALFAFVLFHEHAGRFAVLALVIIFAGTLLLNLDFSAPRSRRLNIVPGLSEVGLATVLAAFWTLGWDKYVSGRDALISALCMYAFMTIAAILLALLMGTKGLARQPTEKKFLFLMGLGEAVAYLAISWGYSKTSLTGIVALVSGAFSLPTLVLAYFFLKERLSKLQWFSVAVIILGVVVISIA